MMRSDLPAAIGRAKVKADAVHGIAWHRLEEISRFELVFDELHQPVSETYKLPGHCGPTDALQKALFLLDTFAGQGLGHVYGNGQEIDADVVCAELTSALGIEMDAGWWREVPRLLGAPGGWIVAAADEKRFRTWKDGFSAWTEDRELATRYARREDAEAVHMEDEDAWRVIRYNPIRGAGDTALDFYATVLAYSYPEGVPVTVRVHDSGWDVYDPSRHSSAPIPNPSGKVTWIEWFLLACVIIGAGWAMT